MCPQISASFGFRRIGPHTESHLTQVGEALPGSLRPQPDQQPQRFAPEPLFLFGAATPVQGGRGGPTVCGSVRVSVGSHIVRAGSSGKSWDVSECISCGGGNASGCGPLGGGSVPHFAGVGGISTVRSGIVHGMPSIVTPGPSPGTGAAPVRCICNCGGPHMDSYCPGAGWRHMAVSCRLAFPRQINASWAVADYRL